MLQPSVHALWHSLQLGADSQAPLYYLIVRLFSRVTPNAEIAYRLPSILGFCLTLCFLFLWFRKRYDLSTAIIASLLSMVTVLYGTYATEARAYSLVVACLTLGLVAYRNAPALRWMLLLGGSLAVAQSLHYYSIFAMTPFFLAESAVLLKTRTVRWSVWGAFAVGVLPLAAFWPLLARLKEYYGQYFWAQPSLLTPVAIYGWLFGISTGIDQPLRLFSVVYILFFSGIIISSAVLLFRSLSADPNQDLFWTDGILISGFLLLPFVYYLATKITHGGLFVRYLIPTVIGIALGAGHGLSRLSTRLRLIIGGALCLALFLQETAFWLNYYTDYMLGFSHSQTSTRLINSAGYSELPIMVSDSHDYLEISHYASPELAKRLVSVVDPVAAVAHGRSDSDDKELLVIKQIASVHVVDYSRFRFEHLTFLLYSKPGWQNNPDWWVLQLLKDGYSLKSLVTDGTSSVYLAEAKPRS